MGKLFDQLGGKEWVRGLGAKLDGPVGGDVVRLAVAGPNGCNRVVVTSRPVRGRTVYRVEWWRVSADGEDAEPGQVVEGDFPAAVFAGGIEREAAAARAELVA